VTAPATPAPDASADEELLQRPPAEVRYADELAALRAADDDPRPPGWQLSLRATAASSSATPGPASAASSSATPPWWSGRW
jgi:hypothetical protein